MGLPIMKKPCKNCPFRKDSLQGWLGKDRATEIAKTDTFVCHKSVDYENEKNKSNRLQCAGFMLMRKEESSAVRFAKMLHLDLQLSGDDLVFENESEFINHHSN